ncbi:MAG: phosphatase PAP2 family protein, partial [Bacteroidota bacterium]
LLYGALSDDRSALNTGVLLGVAQSLSFGTASLMKSAVNRPRPFEVLRDVKVKLFSEPTGASFPSGHAAQAFAVATMLSLRYKPAVSLPAFVWAGLVAYGRVYVGVHYPTDVLGGMAVGAILSALAFQYRSDIIKTKDRIFNTGDPNYHLTQSSPIIALRIQLP